MLLFLFFSLALFPQQPPGVLVLQESAKYKQDKGKDTSV